MKLIMPTLNYKDKAIEFIKEFYQYGSEINGSGALDWCMENADKIRERDYETLLYMIKESCKIKRDVVEKDPTEKGDRALLNFGHTLGHAVEKLKNFEMLHGQCVAVGLIGCEGNGKERG